MIDGRKRTTQNASLALELSINKVFVIFFLLPNVGDGNVTGKFELVYDEGEENEENEEEDSEVRIAVVV